jgi:hypothetical protein
MVDLRSVHTVDTAPDNPWAHNMLKNDDKVGNLTTSPRWSAWLQIDTNVTEMLAEGSEHNCTASWQSELVNEWDRNTSWWNDDLLLW